MWLDQWLVQKLAKFLHYRYGETLRGEAHKWAELTERNRLSRLKAQLGTCGIDITVRTGVQILVPEQVHLGSHVAVGYYSILQGLGGIRLDDFVLLGDHVVLATSSHPTTEFHFHNSYQKPIHLKENVWLGANVMVLPGVTIGENAAIGAGAVVTTDIPPNSVAVGVPARVIETIAFDPNQLASEKESIRQIRLKRIQGRMD